MSPVPARAGGKVILLGEHAVVYGAPALAVGIARGARATAEPAALASIRLGERHAQAGDGSDVGQALGALLAALGRPPHAVEVDLELWPGRGLGASAAVAVAAARAVLGASADDALVLRAADAWERVFHGNPSGVDAAAAAYGGCLLYSRAEGVRPIALGAPLSLVVGVVGPAPSTRAMVEGVRRLRERRTSAVDEVIEGIAGLVRRAAASVGAGDTRELGRLMDENQGLLSALEVSTESIERACALARGAGALGAKLTGAGGGGCVVALAGGDAQPILTAFAEAGLEAFEARVPAGAREESDA